MNTSPIENPFTDQELVKLLPGFSNAQAQVNHTSLHYVHGGQGQPLVLLPGWPETWWAYHKIMPLLAPHYHVIAVDIRGMGSSDKPETGYDKKNMATDIHELIQALGYTQVSVAGHDIGAHVAFSFAANFRQATAKLIMLDTPHPDENMYRLPMLPLPASPDGQETGNLYPWWLAFNQVKGLPEQLLAGRVELLHDHIFSTVSAANSAISSFDRGVYAAAYNNAANIRAGNAWYQAFPQDIADMKAYSKLTMPVLGIGGSGYEMLKLALPPLASQLQLAEVKEGGHFFFEEQPEQTAKLMLEFLK